MGAGARRIFPLTIIAGPVGLIYGATAVENGLSESETIFASFVIMAAAAQIALVQLIGDESSWAVVVGTTLIINLRFALYSATIASTFAEFPRRWRFALTHVLVDQTAMIALREFETERDPFYRHWFFLGSVLFFVTPWVIGTTIGALLGGEISNGWQLGFAVPATFIALVVPSIKNRPMLVAALVGGFVAVAASFLPNGLNIIAGAFCGIAAGVIAAPTPEPGS